MSNNKRYLPAPGSSHRNKKSRIPQGLSDQLVYLDQFVSTTSHLADLNPRIYCSQIQSLVTPCVRYVLPNSAPRRSPRLNPSLSEKKVSPVDVSSFIDRSFLSGFCSSVENGLDNFQCSSSSSIRHGKETSQPSDQCTFLPSDNISLLGQDIIVPRTSSPLPRSPRLLINSRSASQGSLHKSSIDRHNNCSGNLSRSNLNTDVQSSSQLCSPDASKNLVLKFNSPTETVRNFVMRNHGNSLPGSPQQTSVHSMSHLTLNDSSSEYMESTNDQSEVMKNQQSQRKYTLRPRSQDIGHQRTSPPNHSQSIQESSITSQTNQLHQNEPCVSASSYLNCPTMSNSSSESDHLPASNRDIIYINENSTLASSSSSSLTQINQTESPRLSKECLHKSATTFIQSLIHASSEANFDDQTLVILHQESSNVPRDVLVDPMDLTWIIGIERSSSGQIYFTHSLEKSLHFTIRTSDFSKLKEFLMTLNPKIKSQFLEKLRNFSCAETKTSVINEDTIQNCKPIHKAKMCLDSMFRNGLSSAFTHNERKRGSSGASTNNASPEDTSKPNHKFIPSISLGFTQQVTQEYRNSRSSIGGNVRPFLRDGNVPCGARRYLLELVKHVLSSCPMGNCFEVGVNCSGIYVRIREEMIAEFETMLGGDGTYSGKFRVEGIAILIPFGIGDHRDLMNCGLPGTNSVVAIHVKLSMSCLEEMDCASLELKNFLASSGYLTDFPCAVILYGRKICHMHSLRFEKIQQYSRLDTLREVVFWALTKRVGDKVDYNHLIMDNARFMEVFNASSSVRRESKFKGRAMRTVASYNKMVSLVFHISIYLL